MQKGQEGHQGRKEYSQRVGMTTQGVDCKKEYIDAQNVRALGITKAPVSTPLTHQLHKLLKLLVVMKLLHLDIPQEQLQGNSSLPQYLLHTPIVIPCNNFFHCDTHAMLTNFFH